MAWYWIVSIGIGGLIAGVFIGARIVGNAIANALGGW